MAGTMAVETTEALKNQNICGMLGNYDGNPDFDNDGFSDYLEKLDYQMDQEIETYYKGDKKCPYVSDDTIKAGVPIPINSGSYFHTLSRRKRDTESMDEDSCSGNWNEIRTKCGIIYDNLRFGSCGLDKTTYFNGCVFDGCSAPSNLDNFVCEMLSAFVTSCNNADEDLGYSISSWRSSSSFSYTYDGNTVAFADLCVPSCGPNQIFHACAKPECFPTTQNCNIDTAACLASTECVEGCFCAAGYLQDGNSCSQTCAESQIEQMENEIATNDPCGSGPCQNGATCTNDGSDYVCDCVGSSWSGKNCDESTDVSISAPIDVLNALFDLSAPSRKKRSVIDFLNHGCFCRNLDGSKHQAGKPISDYDRICKDLSVCSKCRVGNFEASERYPYLLSLDGDVGDYEYICDPSKLESPRKEQCECDMAHVKRLLDHLNDTGDEVTTGMAGRCVANPPAVGGNTISCCGQDSYFKLYNTADKQCIDVDGNMVVAPL